MGLKNQERSLKKSAESDNHIIQFLCPFFAVGIIVGVKERFSSRLNIRDECMTFLGDGDAGHTPFCYALAQALPFQFINKAGHG